MAAFLLLLEDATGKLDEAFAEALWPCAGMVAAHRRRVDHAIAGADSVHRGRAHAAGLRNSNLPFALLSAPAAGPAPSLGIHLTLARTPCHPRTAQRKGDDQAHQSTRTRPLPAHANTRGALRWRSRSSGN